MSVLSQKCFHDEPAAFAHLEGLLWPEGPTCPHCGNADAKRIKRFEGKATRIGLLKCNECRKQFTVKVGTVFESAHIPLHKMLQAVYLLTCSKKGCSAHQMHRILQITYKSAWFLCHRIREAMRVGKFEIPMGGSGKIVEADETYFGNIPESQRPQFKKSGRPYQKKPKGGYAHKRAIVALVERGGDVRSFHVHTASADGVAHIVRKNIDRETRLQTDESKVYHRVGKEFSAHETVNHSAYEYARGDVTTNTVEGYFSVFKRGMRGTYQHCSEKHLQRYLAEFDFRYNSRIALGVNDETRAGRALKGISGKRLTYRNPHVTAAE
jgi:transposase-like protein